MDLRGTVSHTGWGAALVGVLAVLVIGWTGYELARWPPDPPAAPDAAQAAQVTRQDGQEAAPKGKAERLTVVGDSYAAGTGANDPARTGFPELLGRCLGVPVTVVAEGEVGYLPAGTDSMAGLVRDADLPRGGTVVFAAGIQDRPEVVAGATVVELREAAARAWRVAEEAGAGVVVVGPFWPAAELTDPAIRTVRDALREEADEHGFTFVDPTGWLEGRVGPDGAHPTQAGHRFVADRLADALDEAGVATSSC